MITTVILLVFAFVAIVLVIKYFTGRGKRQSERTSVESIVSTVSGAMKRGTRQVAEGLRDAETVRKEYIEKISMAEKQVREDYRIYLTNLIQSSSQLEKIKKEMELALPKRMQEAKEFKEKADATGDAKFEGYAKRMLQGALKAKLSIASCTERLDKLAEDKHCSVIEYELALQEINDKRIEVNQAVLSPESSAAFQLLNIADLGEELKRKVTDRNIQMEVQQTITPKAEAYISSEEVEEAYKNL